MKDRELYSKVYLKDSSAVERAMRDTAKAQSTFIQELKIMIKPKGTVEQGNEKHKKVHQDNPRYKVMDHLE